MGTQHPAPAPAPDAQRRGLLDAQRAAHQDEPRSVKDDALTDKVVSVEPDGTGPTSTGTLDPAQDQQQGSGDAAGKPGSQAPGTGAPDKPRR